MKKRIFSVLLILFIAATLFFGCESKAPDTEIEITNLSDYVIIYPENATALEEASAFYLA